MIGTVLSKVPLILWETRLVSQRPFLQLCLYSVSTIFKQSFLTLFQGLLFSAFDGLLASVFPLISTLK